MRVWSQRAKPFSTSRVTVPSPWLGVVHASTYPLGVDRFFLLAINPYSKHVLGTCDTSGAVLGPGTSAVPRTPPLLELGKRALGNNQADTGLSTSMLGPRSLCLLGDKCEVTLRAVFLSLLHLHYCPFANEPA